MSHRTSPVDLEGMPPGIPYIIGNEAAERFSFYGMRTILVVFMAQYLAFMDGGGGRTMSGTEAVEHYHQFTSWVYFTPLFGALIADVFFGKYRTILWLSIVYCLGHAALACMGSYGNSPWWLLSGLALICIGSGGIKPCVSAFVGDQFDDSAAADGDEGEFGRHEEGGACSQRDEADQAENGENDVHVSSPPEMCTGAAGFVSRLARGALRTGGIRRFLG